MEMNFYRKLSSICYLFGIWCKTLYENYNSINNHSIIPITNIESHNYPKNNTDSKQFNFMAQESLSRRKFFRLIEYLGLNTRQLNVRIYFGDGGGSRIAVRNNNINTGSTSIIHHNAEGSGATDSTISDDNSGGGVITADCKSLNCTDDFNTEQRYPDHNQIGMMGRLKSRKIPKFLFKYIHMSMEPILKKTEVSRSWCLVSDHFLKLCSRNLYAALLTLFSIILFYTEPFDLLNLTDLNLTLSNFHVCLLDKIHESIVSGTDTSQAPSSSLSCLHSLYSVRCNQSTVIYSLIHELPTLNNHHWDDLFYVHGIDIWNHKYQISLKSTILQIEWPSFKMNELINYIHWDYSNENVYQCYNNHVKKLSTNRSSSIQSYFTENYLNNPIHFDGFLENINIFLINSNNSFLMLRVDSQRFIAQFRSINPIYQPLKLDSLSQVTITGTKLVYSCNKTLDNGMDTVSCCSSTSASLSSNSSPCRYAILSSCHIKNDLVLSLPEIHVDVKLPERSFNNSSNTSGQLLVPTINNTTAANTIELNSSNGWHFSIKPIQSYFQFHFKLLTSKHFIIVRVKNTSFQYNSKTITTTDSNISSSNGSKNREVLLTNNTNMDDDNNKNDIGCIVSSRLKVNCEHAVIMCEDQTIAVFQNLKIRQRPENIQHRTEHLKMGFLTRANPSWEFYMDLFYVTFPYRYIFRDIYQEASCVRKFLLKLHSGNITYFHVNDYIFDQSSPTFIQSSPSKFEISSSSTARKDFIQPSTSYIKQDRIIHIKKFIIEIKDDPFECKLNDIHTILLDEFAIHEKRVNTLREQFNRAIHSGIRITDEERQACFTRIEIQRAQDYRNRLHRFYRDYAFSDELFTFTMDNLKIKALADESITHDEQVIAQMKIMDSDSPWPNLTEQDFSTLWCRIITMNVERWRFHLRDYPKPCLNITDLFLWGKLVVAEQLADSKGQRKVPIEPGYPWPNYTLIRSSSPTKFYYDLNAGVIRIDGDLDLVYQTASKYDGICRLFHIPHLEMTVKLDWLSLRDPNDHHSVKYCCTDCLTTREQTQHDSFKYFRANRLAMDINFTVKPPPTGSSTMDQRPWCSFYTSVLKFADKLRNCLSQIPRPIRRGSLYQYKPPRKPHFGRLLQVKLDWLSLRDPNDHHSVKYCCTDCLTTREQTQHDSFKYFRANRLAMDINFTVKPPPTGSSTMDQRPWCSFYTSVLKFADKLRTNDISSNHQLNHHNFSIHDIEQLDTKEMNNDTEAFILVPLLRYQQLCPTVLPSNITVRVHIPGPRSTTMTSVTESTTNTTIKENSNIYNNSSGNTNLSPSSIECHLIESIKNNTSINSTSTITENISADVTSTSHVDDEKKLPFSHNNNNRTTHNNTNHIPTPRYNSTATPCSSNNQLTHEDLTPVHHLEIHEFKMRWTEQHRNLVYILMDSYRHAQSLKKNLSARALHGFRLHPGGSSNGHTTTMTSGGGGTALSRNARSAIQLTNSVNNNGCKLLNSTDKRPLSTVIQQTELCHLSKSTKSNYNDNYLLTKMPTNDEVLPDNIDMSSNSVTMVTATTTTNNNNNNNSEMEENNYDHVYLSANSSPSSESNKTKLTFFKQIPMLAQLLEEVDTARFYAYCEEEPKQTDVVSQLQGLHICASSLVAERNWHLELINPQFVRVVEKLDDWTHHNLNADEDALSGRPEVVGCGRSVGGVVTACVGFPKTPSNNNNNISNNKNSLTRTSTLTFGTKLMSNDATLKNNVTLTSIMTTTTPTTTTITSSTSKLHTDNIRPIQLQRMISRCSCEVFYIHYEPADPANLPLPHLIPPLSLDETEVVRNPEGADTVTLLHHTLNVSTNSLQYHMIVEIVNDLLLYVEPQRKAKLERNRLTFGLMSESQVRLAILRDQETLRRLISEQRQLERYLWSYVRQTMQELGLNANNTLIDHSYPTAFYHSPTTDSSNNVTSRASNLTLKLVDCIQSARQLETQINQLKSRIIDLNGILSQRLGHYQQLQIQIQRRHIRKAMSFRRYHPINKSSACSSLLSFNNETLSSITNCNNVSLVQKTSNDDFNRIIQTNNIDSETYIQNRINLHRASSIDYLTHPITNTMNNNNNTETVISESGNKSLLSSSFMDGGDSKPAEIVRRSEVCFEHARWRMTENDGQIGLADVELRGFIYTKTHRQDDSGSHRLELGWIRVCSLAPNSFYREVLAPDVSGGRYAGGPILRIACSDLAPVGGISVKEAMEISVAPILLQMSKQFYRIMMPFFFPEKTEDTTTTNTVTATPVHTVTVANPIGDGINSSAFTSHPFFIPQDNVGSSSGIGSVAFHYLDSNLSTNPNNLRYSSENIGLPSKSWLRRYLSRYLPHRLKNESESVPSVSSSLPQPLNVIHKSHQSDILENISSDLSMPIVVSTAATTVTLTSSLLSPASVYIPSNNLTIEAATSGRNYCSVNDDWNALSNNNATGSGTETTVASSLSLTSSFATTSKLLQMMNMRTNESEFPNLFHTNESDVKSSLSHNHKSNECFSIPLTHYSNYNDTTTDNFIMLMQQPSICLQQLLPVNNICTYCKSIHSTSSNHLHSLNMSWYNPMNYGSLPTDQVTSVNQIAMHHSKHNINNTNIPLNPVDVMQIDEQYP
uniref:UPF0378 protein n=1 Tax=Schistosoma haematobium TaxID=6185 RepID=A0A094ZX33_SCHHA